jgi:homoserine kinase type II
MAVYTEVSFDEAAALIARLGIGELSAIKPCVGGIENTNYFASTEQGEWVLTLFERLSHEQLPFYLHLMKHLAERGIPVPDPQADANGQILHELRGKPATLVDRLPGVHRLEPGPAHLRQVGAMLARMHGAGADFGWQQPNLRGLAWWEATVPVVLPFLDDERAALMRDELGYQCAAAPAAAALPHGAIHADLFRDNVVFDTVAGEDRLSGFFDFFFAGIDSFAFDLAVCLNDWCSDPASGKLNDAHAALFIAAYEGVRPLTPAEHRLMPTMLRAAAFRFWLSRLWDLHLPREASVLKAHDPAPLERVLRERIAQPWRAVH